MQELHTQTDALVGSEEDDSLSTDSSTEELCTEEESRFRPCSEAEPPETWPIRLALVRRIDVDESRIVSNLEKCPNVTSFMTNQQKCCGSAYISKAGWNPSPIKHDPLLKATLGVQQQWAPLEPGLSGGHRCALKQPGGTGNPSKRSAGRGRSR